MSEVKWSPEHTPLVFLWVDHHLARNPALLCHVGNEQCVKDLFPDHDAHLWAEYVRVCRFACDLQQCYRLNASAAVHIDVKMAAQLATGPFSVLVCTLWSVFVQCAGARDAPLLSKSGDEYALNTVREFWAAVGKGDASCMQGKSSKPSVLWHLLVSGWLASSHLFTRGDDTFSRTIRTLGRKCCETLVRWEDGAHRRNVPILSLLALCYMRSDQEKLARKAGPVLAKCLKQMRVAVPSKCPHQLSQAPSGSQQCLDCVDEYFGDVFDAYCQSVDPGVLYGLVESLITHGSARLSPSRLVALHALYTRYPIVFRGHLPHILHFHYQLQSGAYDQQTLEEKVHSLSIAEFGARLATSLLNAPERVSPHLNHPAWIRVGLALCALQICPKHMLGGTSLYDPNLPSKLTPRVGLWVASTWVPHLLELAELMSCGASFLQGLQRQRWTTASSACLIQAQKLLARLKRIKDRDVQRAYRSIVPRYSVSSAHLQLSTAQLSSAAHALTTACRQHSGITTGDLTGDFSLLHAQLRVRVLQWLLQGALGSSGCQTCHQPGECELCVHVQCQQTYRAAAADPDEVKRMSPALLWEQNLRAAHTSCRQQGAVESKELMGLVQRVRKSVGGGERKAVRRAVECVQSVRDVHDKRVCLDEDGLWGELRGKMYQRDTQEEEKLFCDLSVLCALYTGYCVDLLCAQDTPKPRALTMWLINSVELLRSLYARAVGDPSVVTMTIASRPVRSVQVHIAAPSQLHPAARFGWHMEAGLLLCLGLAVCDTISQGNASLPSGVPRGVTWFVRQCSALLTGPPQTPACMLALWGRRWTLLRKRLCQRGGVDKNQSANGERLGLHYCSVLFASLPCISHELSQEKAALLDSNLVARTKVRPCVPHVESALSPGRAGAGDEKQASPPSIPAPAIPAPAIPAPGMAGDVSNNGGLSGGAAPMTSAQHSPHTTDTQQRPNSALQSPNSEPAVGTPLLTPYRVQVSSVHGHGPAPRSVGSGSGVHVTLGGEREGAQDVFGNSPSVPSIPSPQPVAVTPVMQALSPSTHAVSSPPAHPTGLVSGAESLSNAPLVPTHRPDGVTAGQTSPTVEGPAGGKSVHQNVVLQSQRPPSSPAHAWGADVHESGYSGDEKGVEVGVEVPVNDDSFASPSGDVDDESECGPRDPMEHKDPTSPSPSDKQRRPWSRTRNNNVAYVACPLTADVAGMLGKHMQTSFLEEMERAQSLKKPTLRGTKQKGTKVFDLTRLMEAPVRAMELPELMKFARVCYWGEIFVKSGRRGKPHDRTLRVRIRKIEGVLDLDWGSGSVAVKTGDKCCIVLGKHSKVFARQACNMLEHDHSMTLLTPTRALDLTAYSQRVRDLWYRGLSCLLEVVRRGKLRSLQITVDDKDKDPIF